MDAPIERMTSAYTTNVKNKPLSVPDGIDRLGFLRSPDMLAPANIPAVAGNLKMISRAQVSIFDTYNIPNRFRQFSLKTGKQMVQRVRISYALVGRGAPCCAFGEVGHEILTQGLHRESSISNPLSYIRERRTN